MNAGLSVALAAVLMSITGCRGIILETVMTTVEPYFHGPGIDGTKFEQLSDKVYTFRWNWYRNLIVVTDAGLVVIDPMNTEMATALKQELDRKFPDQKIHTLIYSHYHLDHTRGGAALAPVEVVAHAKCATYWNEFEHRDVLEPTRVITGDQTLNIGGMEIRALYLGLSHTDTLYAFHLPSEELVFTADLGLVKSVAPVGVPDRYAPGYLAALNRVAALDFEIFVPSHFGYGTKRDLIEWRDMMEESRRLAREALNKSGILGARNHQMARYFDTVYYPMRAKYGSWHGFNEMFILNLVRDIEGEMLGH